MAKLIMLAGGIGNQTGESVPGVVQKTVWEAGVPTDFMGSNGEAIVDISAASLTYGAVTCTIAGDYSDAVIGMYAMVTGLTSTNDGYFEITDKNGSNLTISVTNLTGDSIEAGDNGDSVDVLIGGAANKGSDGASIENCDDHIISFIDTDTYSIDILYNKDETATGSFTIEAASSLLHKIRLIGTTYSATANNCFQPIDNDNANLLAAGTMPELDMDSYAFTNTGNIEYHHLNITGTNVNNVIISTGMHTVFNQCIITQTNTSGLRAISLTSGVMINCKVSSVGTNASYQAVRLERAFAVGCFIESASNGGVYLSTSYRVTQIIGCIVSGGSTANTNKGIAFQYNTNINSPVIAMNNIIYNFDDSIYLYDMPDIDDYSVCIFNNILWGTNNAGSYGIFNASYATKTSTAYIDNNFIGNVTNEDNFDEYDCSNISLTTCPFINAGGSYELASDFLLDNEIAGGALIKDKIIPRDMDFDGIQDNFQSPAIMSKSSGGFVVAGLGRFGVQES